MSLQFARHLLPLAGVLFLAGCTGSLLDSEAPVLQTYVLAPAAAAQGTAAATQDIVVGEPSAAPGLATERIAVLHPDRRLEYYAGARWGDTAGHVMQSFIVGSLRNQGTFRSVTAAPAGTTATHAIDFELRDFQAEYPREGVAPTVRVSLVANIIRISDRRLLAVIPATAAVPASDNRLTAVIAAFEAAGRNVAVALGRETAAAVAADRR